MNAVVEARVRLVRAAVSLYELRAADALPSNAPEFDQVIHRAQQHVVKIVKHGAPLSAPGLHNMINNIEVARSLGDEGCPDQLLASIARSTLQRTHQPTPRVAYPARDWA